METCAEAAVWNGPPWFSDPSQWPADFVTMVTDDSNAEKKVQRELFALGVEANDDFDTVLEKFGLREAMRICVWISRFNHNSPHPSERIMGPLTTEIQRHEMSRIKRAQSQGAKTVTFARDQEQLNLQLNTDGVLECRGRIQSIRFTYQILILSQRK